MTRPVRVRLTLSGGARVEIDAYPTPTPGLVIHRTFGQPDDVYTVTQQHSGVALANYLPSPEAALGLACDLGPLADWTQPVSAAVARRGIPIARRWGWGRGTGAVLLAGGINSYREAGAIL